jgi:hypothetical protein
MAQLDQWAIRMHEKIEERHNELHMTFDQIEKKFQENKDDVKIHLEENVSCVLRKQLEEFEINNQQMKKANQELNLLQNFVHLFNNQQLITININTENQMILNQPTIICSDIIVDGLNFNPSDETTSRK